MPALPVVFTRPAVRQIEAAAEWWRVNRQAAPSAFGDELAAAVALIAEQSASGALIQGPRHRGVRRVHLPIVGYHLYHRVAPRLRQVQVLASWHVRRGSPPAV